MLQDRSELINAQDPSQPRPQSPPAASAASPLTPPVMSQQSASAGESATSLPASTTCLSALFKSAATQVAQLYRQSMIQSRDAYLEGYAQCVRDVLQHCQQHQQEHGDHGAWIAVESLLSLFNHRYAHLLSEHQQQSLKASAESEQNSPSSSSCVQNACSSGSVDFAKMPPATSTSPPAPKRSRSAGKRSAIDMES